MPKKSISYLKKTYKVTTVGKKTFKTASMAVRSLLRLPSMTQASIARKCNVSEAYVSQLAKEIRI